MPRDVESLKIVQYMFSLILKLAGITVTVKGAENIPRDRAVLFVGNHRSYFDILVGYTTVRASWVLWRKRRWRGSPF